MRKRKSEEEERRRREKSNGCTLSFYSGYFGDIFWPEKKNCWTENIRSIWWKRFQKSAGQISRHRNKSPVPASLATDGKEKNWTSIQNILSFFFFFKF